MNIISPKSFSQKLLRWHESHRRPFPWRKDRDPYKVWLSEIILQQTRVAQGLPYYDRFIETYPTIYALAQATEEEVLRLWQGLGYYRRGRYLHGCAQYIVKELGGVFPNTYEELLKLPGVGPYTAAAIASMAFNKPRAAVDGNVYRVLARIFGLGGDITKKSTQKEFTNLATSLLDRSKPGSFNEALMEFGALHCTATKPGCSNCIFHDICVARKKQKQSFFPVKKKKAPLTHRFFHYVVINYQGKIHLNKRKEKDIWYGLYDFYLVEATCLCAFEALQDELVYEIKKKKIHVKTCTPYDQHLLTHQKIHAMFHYVVIDDHLDALANNAQFFSYEEVRLLPLPVLIANFFKKHLSWLQPNLVSYNLPLKF